MPDQGAPKYRIVVAQAEHGIEAAPSEHGVGTEAAHAGTEQEGGGNPLTHHSPWQFTICGGIVAGIMIVLAVLAMRNRKKIPTSRLQLLVEWAYERLNAFTVAAIGPGGERYTPLIATLFVFILFSNYFGMLPTVFFRGHEGVQGVAVAPTANLSMTIALALVVFVTVQAVGIRTNGFGGHMKHLAGPIPALSWFMFPIEVIGEIARPVSLSIRLFGNIFGEETVIAILIGLAASLLPAFLPIPFQFPILVFGAITGLVQALVFSLLACVYIALAIGDHAAHGEAHDEHEPLEGHERVAAAH